VSWSLDNVEDRVELSDGHFEIPPRAVRESLVFGDSVKLIFLPDVVGPDLPSGAPAPTGERMWVTVTKVADGRYEGELANEPIVVDAEKGALIAFGPENVCDVDHSDTLASVFAREAQGGPIDPSEAN
jgi:hypothetical protein